MNGVVRGKRIERNSLNKVFEKGINLPASLFALDITGSTVESTGLTKALLNVIADAKTKVYGDADPSLTYQVSGLKNGDTAGAVLNGGGLVRVSGENVGNYAIQQGGLGLVSGNYDLAYQGNVRRGARTAKMPLVARRLRVPRAVRSRAPSARGASRVLRLPSGPARATASRARASRATSVRPARRATSRRPASRRSSGSGSRWRPARRCR